MQYYIDYNDQRLIDYQETIWFTKNHIKINERELAREIFFRERRSNTNTFCPSFCLVLSAIKFNFNSILLNYAKRYHSFFNDVKGQNRLINVKKRTSSLVSRGSNFLTWDFVHVIDVSKNCVCCFVFVFCFLMFFFIFSCYCNWKIKGINLWTSEKMVEKIQNPGKVIIKISKGQS